MTSSDSPEASLVEPGSGSGCSKSIPPRVYVENSDCPSAITSAGPGRATALQASRLFGRGRFFTLKQFTAPGSDSGDSDNDELFRRQKRDPEAFEESHLRRDPSGHECR